MEMMITINIMLLTAIVVGFGMFLHFKTHGGRSTEYINGHIADAASKGRVDESTAGEERFHLAPLGDLDEEYMNLFSNPPMDKPARRGKSAYLRDAYHERIRRIVNALNIEGVNISSYVDMVLTDHLMRYEDQIDKLIQNYCCPLKLKRA